MPGKLIATRGLPASGKSTWAKLQRDAANISRDEIRYWVSKGEPWPWGETAKLRRLEDKVTGVQQTLIAEFLKNDICIIVHDTNLNPEHMAALESLAFLMDAAFQIKDFTDVPLGECIFRDATRLAHDRVGEAVIRRMYEKYIKCKVCPDDCRECAKDNGTCECYEHPK